MSSVDSDTVVRMKKLGDDILAKHITCSSLAETETLHIDFWI
jgi:hypothetical protein